MEAQHLRNTLLGTELKRNNNDANQPAAFSKQRSCGGFARVGLSISKSFALGLLVYFCGCKNSAPRPAPPEAHNQRESMPLLQPLAADKVDHAAGQQDSADTDNLSNLSIGETCCTFPFSDRKILDDFTTGGRSFGAGRGDRKHAATDLLKDYQTSVSAIADGEILDFYEFYQGTHAAVVDHTHFVARYGEIKALAAGLKIGSRVKKGQKIATVGQLYSGAAMLHLELYKGTLNGELSTPGNAYNRRADLFDPSSCVRLWMKSDTAEKCWEKVPAVGGN